jgi:hypothetical protein
MRVQSLEHQNPLAVQFINGKKINTYHYSKQLFLARIYPFLRNPKPDAKTIVESYFPFLDLTKNQRHGKIICQKVRVLPDKESQVFNFG